MKVNGSTEPVRLDVATGKPATKAAGGAAAPASASSVHLSDGVSSLAAGDSGAEFDAGRVEQIKQSIRDGRFSVDSGVVADKLIANVNDLFGNVH